MRSLDIVHNICLIWILTWGCGPVYIIMLLFWHSIWMWYIVSPQQQWLMGLSWPLVLILFLIVRSEYLSWVFIKKRRALCFACVSRMELWWLYPSTAWSRNREGAETICRVDHLVRQGPNEIQWLRPLFYKSRSCRSHENHTDPFWGFSPQWPNPLCSSTMLLVHEPWGLHPHGLTKLWLVEGGLGAFVLIWPVKLTIFVMNATSKCYGLVILSRDRAIPISSGYLKP